MLKKGAMFGLDARIALAIFGALSVISGAALYSAIQNSKVTALLTESKEVLKAVEQYYLDTGVMPPRSSSSTIAYNSYNLIENVDSIAGWKGPYLPFTINSASTDQQKPIYGSIFGGYKLLGRSKNDAWGGTSGVDVVLPSTCTGSSEPCGVWVHTLAPNCSVAEALDKQLDTTLDYKTGKMRIYKTSSACYIYILGDMVAEPTS